MAYLWPSRKRNGERLDSSAADEDGNRQQGLRSQLLKALYPALSSASLISDLVDGYKRDAVEIDHGVGIEIFDFKIQVLIGFD